MALTVGSRLGHYDVTALIGEGGMGQVYQATDTKLNLQAASALEKAPERRSDGTWQYGWLIRSASVGHGMEHDIDPEGVAVR